MILAKEKIVIKNIEGMYQDGQLQPTEPPQRVINAWYWGAQDQLIANTTVMGDRLLIFSCAMEKLEIAFSDLSCLKLIPIDERGDFTISEEGSYLHWPKQDIHPDLDALRYAIYPNFKHKFDAYKLTHDQSFGKAIATLRKQSKLKQSDIMGLSERQVIRIEKGEGIKVETLDLFAQAHQMELNDYLEAVANLMMDISEDFNLTSDEISIEPVAIRAWAEERIIYVELSDGRIIGFAGDRFRILKEATNEQLAAVKVEVNGYAASSLLQSP